MSVRSHDYSQMLRSFGEMLDVYAARGDIGGYIPLLRDLITIKPDDMTPYGFLATAYERRGDPEEYKNFLIELAQANPKTAGPAVALNGARGPIAEERCASPFSFRLDSG